MAQRIWSPDVASLGDRIAGLTAHQATLLSDYLATRYGIHATSLLLQPSVPEPDVLIDDGLVVPAVVDVVLESFESTRKISVIRALREQLSLGLKEAKELTDVVPRVIQ